MSSTDAVQPPLPELVEKNHKPDWCLGCPLYTAPGPVFGPVPKRNKILYLGEAPGGDEIDFNRNFIGGSGRVLRKWCKSIGTDLEQGEVRNVVKCRPTQIGAGGREIDRAPTEAEIRHCSRFLAEELAAIRPNLIVALGATALYVTTGRVQISTYRGRIIEGPLLKPLLDGEGGVVEEERRVKVLGLYHPAFIMRSQEMWPLAVFDLSKSKKEKTFPEIIRIQTDYNTSGSLRCSREEFVATARRVGFVVFDLEAEGIQGRKGKGLDLNTGVVTVMGLATEPYKADALHWSPDTQRLFRELAADPEIEKVGQNSEGFDIPYLEKKGVVFRGKSFDTLQAFHLTNPDMEKNLEFISSLYTDMDLWKGKEMYQSGFAALKMGNCKDIDATCRTYLRLKQELKENDQWDLYYNSVMPLQPVLRAMSDRGLKRNEELVFKLSKGCELLAAKHEKTLHEALGYDINLDSPKQLSTLLYDTMGLPVQTKRDKKRGQIPTVNDDALDALAKLTNNPIFALIHKRRKILKLKSTYLDGVEPGPDGHIHYKIGSAKAATEKGRDEFGKEKGSAARNGRLISWGPNQQNQPLEIREVYIPDDDEHVFLEIDWSQVEWAASMVLGGEPEGLKLLAAGADNHTITAAECFGLTIDQVKAEDAKYSGGWGSPRFATKFIVYGLGYGRGAVDIAKQLGQSVPWVESFIQRFRTKFPVYWKWRSDLESEVKQNNYLRNFIGRRRYWYTRQVTEMYNFPPSSTAADMMYLVLPQIERELPDGASLRLTVHDSVLVNSARDSARRAADCLRTIMQQPWENITNYSRYPATVRRYFPNGWHCRADTHCGVNWKECKKGNKQLEKELGI